MTPIHLTCLSIVTASCLFSAACDKKPSKSAQTTEAPRVFQPSEVLAEVSSVLRTRFAVRDQTIVLKDEFDMGLVAFRTPADWKLSCGLLGFELTISPEESIQLSQEGMTVEECGQVLLPAMNLVREKLSGSAS